MALPSHDATWEHVSRTVPHTLLSQQGHPPPPPPYEQYLQYIPLVMEHHHGYLPRPEQQISQLPAEREKHKRASQACFECRNKRQRCDEATPCSKCRKENQICQYSKPVKTARDMERVLSALGAHTAECEALTAKLDSVESALRRVERANNRGNTLAGAGAQPITQALADRKAGLDDHRTASDKLLSLWPSIHTLIKAARVNVNEGYVMAAEDRSILRLHTRGEGTDEYDGTQPVRSTSPAQSDDSGGKADAPTLTGGLWGTGFQQTASSEIRRPGPYTWSGLQPDKLLDLDRSTIWSLHDSYIKHIHVLHPFLDKVILRKLFTRFEQCQCVAPKDLEPSKTFATMTNDNELEERPLKQQRLNDSSSVMTSCLEGTNFHSQCIDRSPWKAIAYLVLALGKICLHKVPLPSLIFDNKANTNAAIVDQVSPPISLWPVPDTTQPMQFNHGRGVAAQSCSSTASIDGMCSIGTGNIDVIPGLAYYAKAAEILGDYGDGNELVHAQMFLLAGLYKGQLARVKESMSWITMAGRAVQLLLDRYKLYGQEYWERYSDVRTRFKAESDLVKDKQHSLIVLASWTCLQLESDILAEMKLPASGIIGLENLLIWPKYVPEAETNGGDEALLFYTSQLWLGKRLNQFYNEIYGLDCLNQPIDEVRAMMEGHDHILHEWRRSLPHSLSWEDDDLPAKDILPARLRAKFWGVRYQVNRPFLDFALHIMPLMKEGTRLLDIARDVHGNPRDQAEIRLFEAINTLPQEEILEACSRCIIAAMQSTVALDGVPERLIVTNIHGTAHAQFGNMLVLSATYYNKNLSSLVEPNSLRDLLKRTIRFLGRLRSISPTCSVDCQILEKIYKLLFPHEGIFELLRMSSSS